MQSAGAIKPPPSRGLPPLYYQLSDRVIIVEAERVRWDSEHRAWMHWHSATGWIEIGDPERWFTSDGTTLTQLKEKAA